MNWGWAFRNLLRHPTRTGLAVLGIAVASALLLDMVLLAGGLERSFERLLLSRGFQIRLTPKGTLPFDSEATVGPAATIVRIAREDPDVVEAGGILATNLFLARGDSLLTVTGYGVDPLGQGLYEMLEGRDLAPADSSGVLIGRNVAVELGLRPGDTLRLAGRLDPQIAAPSAERLLVVHGVVRWIYDDRIQRSVGAILPVMQDLSWHGGGDRVSAVMVRVRDDTLASAVAARLGAALPQVSAASTADLVAQFRERVTYFRQLAIILGTISLTVTILLVATILTITVNERLGDIVTLRALGVQRRTVVRQILTEGMLLTIVGAGLGIVLGLLTAEYLDTILAGFPGLPASVSFFVVDQAGLFKAAAVLLATGAAAGAWPAWVASRAPIALTLRAEAP